MAIIDTLLGFFVSNAYAADMAGPGTGGAAGFSPLIIMLIFLLFLYFSVWRPQSKRAKEQNNMLNSLAEGDEVVTIGGVLGKITKITTMYLGLSIADNTQIFLQKSAVANVLPKGTIKSI